MVWPTISGMMVERRDQVLMTLLSIRRFISSILAARCLSTNAPFDRDRDILFLLRLRRDLLSSPNDIAARPPIAPGLVTFCRHAPWAAGVAAPRGLPLAPSHRVVHTIHRDAPVVGPLAKMPLPARLPQGHVPGIQVSDLPHGGLAVDMDPPHLSRGKAELGVIPLLGQQLCRCPGGTNELRPLFLP